MKGLAFLSAAVALLSLSLAGCGGGGASAVVARSAQQSSLTRPKISHIVILFMENRSFDHYFGTYQGVNGLPANPPCAPDPASGQCIYPWHDASTINYGGPHAIKAEAIDVDGGKVDGFIRSVRQFSPTDPQPDDVMGYHTCAEIPVYCRLAANGVLADNMFAASTSYSTMAHLYLVSGWSARCSVPSNPMSCVSYNDVNVHSNPPPDFAWTDLTWILHAHGVSWGYYVYLNSQFNLIYDDGDGEMPQPDSGYSTLGLWNPMPGFDTIKEDGETANIQPGTNFTRQAALGTLPAVCWVIPPFKGSDHPTADITEGQKWAQAMVDAVENGPDAPTTLIILSWDEWGGFYDHVVPPVIDGQGYGMRVPLILIGPLVKSGTIDHQLLSSDAYLKLIEDEFLGGQRIDAGDGRPDARPDVRENAAGLGDLRNDLHFTLP